MPEGDSVYQLSRRLQFMTGREVVGTSIRVPRFALERFDGKTCQRVWPYGKHLFMQFDDRILHTHLKMEGTWGMHLVGDRWRKPAHTARVVLQLTGAPHPRPIEVVGYSLGFVRVFGADGYHSAIADLGPDILADDWESEGFAEAVRRVEARPRRTIGQALLDQGNVAGLGNEYRAEICFLAGVRPTTAVGEVDVPGILRLARRLIWANRLSPVRVTTGIKRAGETSYVFGRNRKPCRRCRTPIEKGMLGGVEDLERVIWWCPVCQR
ncbi:DNA-formamidopyrimidine glycosylase family protein [Corynebacterium uterequi]|uniref:DNA-(apurinic or apyrimidinic site) lyase n=1 Tax=Corynebacterium uterequi TaxID=1072256 RepID=A0A0G3HBB3_9CORY|nr:DNA-formamidopyrimidine glycosylase family protein [Corynebacterium uterequi]AKK10671.1 formamidopyrimidine-DNA glycosylase [Corynebacterium uterequi]